VAIQRIRASKPALAEAVAKKLSNLCEKVSTISTLKEAQAQA